MATSADVRPGGLASRRRSLLSWAPVAVAVLGVLIAAYFVLRPSSTPTGLVGRPAPDFTLQDTAGRTVHLAALRGHPVVLNFWGVSCPPCRREVPLLQDAYQRYSGKGLIILGLDAQLDDAQSVSAFASERGVTYRMLIDGQGVIAPRYGVGDLPHTFFVDRQGIVRASDPAPFLDPGPLQHALAAIL